MRSHTSSFSPTPETYTLTHVSSTVADRPVSVSHRRILRYLVMALLSLLPARSIAQQSSAINGAVTDPSGAAIQNASVTLTNTAQGTSIVVSTNSAGEYSLSGLEAGTYNLEITAPGFEKFAAAGIVVRVSRKERVDA
jgi:hypothetical protein